MVWFHVVCVSAARAMPSGTLIAIAIVISNYSVHILRVLSVLGMIPIEKGANNLAP